MNLTRSIINDEVRLAKEVARLFTFKLPPFAYWGPQEWETAGSEYAEIVNCMLGWDVTDFGSGDFFNTGRVLFTMRNGKPGNDLYPKEYAEKLLIDPENQRAPAHYHRSKREDIICRAGGNILVQLCLADENGQYANKSFTVQKDGCTKRLEPKEIVRLKPGESVNIPPGTIHQFWGEEGTGIELEGRRYTISSEISSVCDDWNDNVFIGGNAARFPELIEDEERQVYLCHEYPDVKLTSI